MRCPGCNKFASMTTEVEDHDLEFEDGKITGTVHLVRRSECCNEDMKETTFDVDHDCGLDEVVYKDKEVSIDYDDPDVTESGGARYAKNMIGFVANVDVKIDGVIDPVWSGSIADEIAASEFEEMC